MTRKNSIRLRRRCVGAAAVAFAGSIGSVSFAESLASNLENQSAGTETASDCCAMAASFTTDDVVHALSSITLLLASPIPGSAVVTVHADGGLEPGQLVATLVAPGAYSPTPAPTAFGVASPVALDAGTTYWIVVAPEEGEFEWSWTTDETGTGTGYTGTWAQNLESDLGAGWWSHERYPLQMAVT
ncbi:MAG: hypothetical protein KDA22_10490, partial [Phycisphaerales bacterium]|nr:hypothetical protein [Phycisphaerales bacterium]